MHEDNKTEVQRKGVGKNNLKLPNKYSLVKAACGLIEKSLQILSSNYCYLHCLLLILILASGTACFLQPDCNRKSTVHVKHYILIFHVNHDLFASYASYFFSIPCRKRQAIIPLLQDSYATEKFVFGKLFTLYISLSCTL